jgi:cation transport ATPase
MATKTIKKTFPILQMGCAACAARVETTVRNQAGVVNAPVERNVQIMKRLVRRSFQLRRVKSRPSAVNKTQFCTLKNRIKKCQAMHNYQVCKAGTLLLGRRSWKLRRTQSGINV